jgi:ABC-type molybdate transport system permease subunit
MRDLLRHHLKGATLMVHSNLPTKKSTLSLAVAKRPEATGSSDQTQGRLDMLTLKLGNLCIGQNS